MDRINKPQPSLAPLNETLKTYFHMVQGVHGLLNEPPPWTPSSEPWTLMSARSFRPTKSLQTRFYVHEARRLTNSFVLSVCFFLYPTPARRPSRATSAANQSRCRRSTANRRRRGRKRRRPALGRSKAPPPLASTPCPSRRTSRYDHVHLL